MARPGAAAHDFVSMPLRFALTAIGVSLLCGCAAEGDFGRIAPSDVHDTVLPATGAFIADQLRGEPVSYFNKTDSEKTLRDRAWTLVLPPHAGDWLGSILVEGQRTRILPELDSRFDQRAYYGLIRNVHYRSSEARWSRVIADMRADAGLIGPFWQEARSVKAGDDQRLAVLDARPGGGPDELADAYARIDENARVVDWVWRSMRFRLASYRWCIDRLAVETPTPRLAEVDLAWRDLQAAIIEAESGTSGLFVARRGGPAPRSRYATQASVNELVPQK